MNFIILAAGKSKKSSGDYNKSCLFYKTKPIILKQIETIKSFNKRARIVCVTGFDSDRIKDLTKDYKITYVHNELYEDTFTLYSLLNGVDSIHGPTFVIHNDVIFSKNNLNLKNNINTVWINKEKSKSVGVNIFNKRVMGFSYGLDYIWQKLTFLDSQTVDKIKNFTILKRDMNKTDFELYNHLIENNVYFGVQQGKLKEIKSIKDL